MIMSSHPQQVEIGLLRVLLCQRSLFLLCVCHFLGHHRVHDLLLREGDPLEEDEHLCVWLVALLFPLCASFCFFS